MVNKTNSNIYVPIVLVGYVMFGICSSFEEGKYQILTFATHFITVFVSSHASQYLADVLTLYLSRAGGGALVDIESWS
jgi:hypothetical protein